MAVVHIIGAGLAGLAAALTASRGDRQVQVLDAAQQAGGRCRSFFDETLGRRIDNGSHLLLAGNEAALDYAREIGALDQFDVPRQAHFPFLDLDTGEAWVVRPNAGPIPWWIFSAARRIPGTGLLDYLAGFRLAFARAGATVAGLFGRSGVIYRRFWEPLALAVLNTPAEIGAARLLWAAVKLTFARGGAWCRPYVAKAGLSEALVDPALAALAARGVQVGFGRRLKSLDWELDRLTALHFADGTVIAVGPGDRVVLALPAASLAQLLPHLGAPTEHHAIVNAHFRLPQPAALPGPVPFLGLVGGTAHWLFVRGDIAAVTVSAADPLAEADNAAIAALLWRDVARALRLPADAPLPPWRVIKEKRATFSQTPAAAQARPGARTPLRNLFLAGDWTDTGLPATIESAVRSGRLAGRLAAQDP